MAQKRARHPVAASSKADSEAHCEAKTGQEEVCPVRVVARFRPFLSTEEAQEDAAFSVTDGVPRLP